MSFLNTFWDRVSQAAKDATTASPIGLAIDAAHATSTSADSRTLYQQMAGKDGHLGFMDAVKGTGSLLTQAVGLDSLNAATSDLTGGFGSNDALHFAYDYGVNRPLGTLSMVSTMAQQGQGVGLDVWRRAYDASDKTSAGQALMGNALQLANTFSGGAYGQHIASNGGAKTYAAATAAGTQEQRDFFQNTTLGKFTSGTADFIMNVGLDPLNYVGAGIAAKSSKAVTFGSKLERDAALDLNAGNINKAQAKAQFGAKVAKRAQRASDKMTEFDKNTHGMDMNTLMQMPEFRDTSDAGALAYFYSRANQLPLDQALALKRDVRAVALGNKAAAERLASARADLSNELDRMTSPIEATRAQSRFSWDDNGQGMFDFTNRPENLRELEMRKGAIQDELNRLDRLHSVAGSTSKFASTARETGEANMRITDLHESVLTDGLGSIPTRVVKGTVGRAAPGHVDAINAQIGHDQLRTLLSRAPLSAALKGSWLTEYAQAATRGDRVLVAQKIEAGMFRELGAKYGKSPSEVKALMQAAMTRRNSYRSALRSRLYTAAPEDNFVGLVDEDGIHHVFERPFLQSQLDDMVPMSDPKWIVKALEDDKRTGWIKGFAERGQQAHDIFDSMASALTRGWKDGALMRLAYPIRIQVDTQLRLMAALGAQEYMTGATHGFRNMLSERLDFLPGVHGNEAEQFMAEVGTRGKKKLKATSLRRTEHYGSIVDPQVKSEMDDIDRQLQDMDSAPHLFRAQDTDPSMGDPAASPSQKPHGLYMSVVKDDKATNSFAQDFTDMGVKWKGRRARLAVPLHDKSVLHVQPHSIDLKGLRGRASLHVDADAGVAALRQVKGEKAFDSLVAEARKGKASFAKYLGAQHPDVEWGRYHDPYEMLMALGGMEARSAGYKALAGEGLTKSEPELVALTDDALADPAKRDALIARRKELQSAARKPINIAPARSAEEAQLHQAALEGSNTKIMVMGDANTHYLGKLRGTGQFGVINGADETWSPSFLRAVNHQLRNSPTSMRTLLEGDDAAVARWVRSDPEAGREWANFRKAYDYDLDAWVHDVRAAADHLLPDDGLRAKALDRNLTDQDLTDAFRTVQSRPAVHGEIFNPIAKTAGGEWYQGVRERWYKFASDAPETVMGRHPFYNSRFRAHMREAIDRHGADELTNSDIDRIRRIADRKARVDMSNTLYDLTSHRNMAHGVRFISPFFAAWDDTMSKWARIFYDKPSSAVNFAKAWQFPDRAGILHKDDQGREYVTLPKAITPLLPEGAQDWRFDRKSLNIVFAGQPWWLPGFGPMVQVPVNEAIKRSWLGANPTWADNPIAKYLLPFGVDDTGIATQVIPGWAKRLKDSGVFDNLFGVGGGHDRNYADTWAMLMAQEQIKYRNGQRKSMPTRKEIDNATRNWHLLRAMSAFSSPVTTEPTPVLQKYIDLAHRYRDDNTNTQAAYKAWEDGGKQGDAPPKDWEEKFYRDFPDYYDMGVSLSVNNTGIVASDKAWDARARFKDVINENPKYGWAVIGPANNGDFSQGVYAAQVTNGDRGQKDPGQAVADVQAGRGWMEYQKMMTGINLELQARGLHSLQQRGAEDLANYRDQGVAVLSQENHAWGTAFADRSSTKNVVDFLQYMTKVSTNPQLKGRGDMKAFRAYMEARSAIQQEMLARGTKSIDAQANADLKDELGQYTAFLSQYDLGFEQMYQRALEADDLSGVIQ